MVWSAEAYSARETASLICLLHLCPYHADPAAVALGQTEDHVGACTVEGSGVDVREYTMDDAANEEEGRDDDHTYDHVA